VSADFDNGFPRYVWARIQLRPHAARLTNSYTGQYKGWPVDETELPKDDEHRLDAESWGV